MAPAEHGMGADPVAGRQELGRRLEAPRLAETDEAAVEAWREGWCWGGEEFRRQMLERAESQWSEHHGGALRREGTAGRAERMSAEERARRRPGDPGQRVLATRRRRQTTLTVKAIVGRLHGGTSKRANQRRPGWMRNPASSPPSTEEQT